MSFHLSQVGYGYGRSGHAIFDGLDLCIESGQRVAVLGASGVGKTTLLYLLGLLWDGRLRGGSIVYDDGARSRCYSDLGRAERARLRRDEFGFIPQSCSFLPAFRCDHNVTMPLRLHGASGERCRQQLKGLVEHHLLQDLKEPLRHHPGQVSGGQRQRMAVLRAIIHNPRVVFADEPVSNLDLVNKTKMIHLLQAWQKGDLLSDNHQPRTLVLVCHEPETAWTLADDFLFLFPRKPGSDEPGPSHCVKLHREDLPGGAEDIRNRLQAGTALLDREHSASPASLSPSPG